MSSCENTADHEVGSGEPALTYAAVQPITAKHCEGCHRDQGIAPFKLTSYLDIKHRAASVKHATQKRMMPPWKADNSGACQTFKNARWLTEEEISTLGRWVDEGMKEGDASVAPSMPEELAVSRSFQVGANYAPQAHIHDDYRCFIIDLQVNEPQFLTAYRIAPSQSSNSVHHLSMAVIDTAEQHVFAETLEAEDALPGYSCQMGFLVPGARILGTWTPGGRSLRYGDDVGIKLSRGARGVVQIHYSTHHGGGPASATGVELELKPRVANVATYVAFGINNFSLPPRKSSIVVQDSKKISDALPGGFSAYRIWGVLPHMHRLGKSFSATATAPANDCLVQVPSWDFAWQDTYIYQHPVTIAATANIHMACTYDTTDKSSEVSWGHGSEDEMCGLGLLISGLP